MKKLTSLICLLALLVLISSCGDDDGPGVSAEEALANEQNLTEETPIPTSEINTSVSIEGATKVAGTAPAPSGSLDFQIDTDQQYASQGTGFTINFNSTDDIAGAYIQFTDVDGNPADGYFDVPGSVFSPTSVIPGRKTLGGNKSLNSRGRTSQDEGFELEIDFDAALGAGEFCYEICLYDDQTNISQIQQICVEVEAWGGNASIVGVWVFDREEPEDAFDDKTTIQCQNGGTVEADYSNDIKDDWTFALNADGSYFEIYDEETQYLDFGATQASCTATYGETEFDNDRYYGFWSWNEDNETLTVVDFGYEDFLNPEESEEYDEGSLYFEGVGAEVINGELVLSEEEEDDGVTYKIIFKRSQ